MTGLNNTDNSILNYPELGISAPYENLDFNKNRKFKINLNYECPKCGGKFKSWDENHITHFEIEKQCPFCHTKKGEYEEQKEDELKEEQEQLKERVEELEKELKS